MERSSDDSHRIHLVQSEARKFIGFLVSKLKKAQSALQSRGSRKRRTTHLTNMDLWELLCQEGYYFDPSQIRRIEKGTAPVDPYLAQALARVLKASETEAALLSHAAGGEGVSAYLLKRLGLEPYLVVCTLRADEAIRGQITVEEFEAIVHQMVETMALEFMRAQQTHTT